jgi:hypothetical protein
MKINWRKSRYSSDQGNCVEAASLTDAVAVRDSKNPDGPALVITPANWRSFTASVKAGRFDLT